MIEIVDIAENKFQFLLKSTSGATLMKSIDFPSKKAITTTVNAIKPQLHGQRLFERRTDHNGKFLFNLKNSKGQIIGKSQLYGSEAGMENGIKNLIRSISNL